MSALLTALTSSTFAQNLLTRTRFPGNQHLHCAVSGGADSLALLLLARLSGATTTAWHVDHSLRDGSQHEFARVRDIAATLGVEARSCTVVVEPGANLEARARAARYAVLPPDVLTGHTADDQAETVLINLLRGSGTAGLAAMRHDQRPLLGLRRSETRALCAELGVEPLHDPMNDDEAFQRVRVRKDVLPLLNDVARRDMVEVLVRQAELLRDDDDLLNELATTIDVHDAKALAAAPLALARRAIRRWLAHPLPPDSATVDRVLSVARGDTAGCEIGNGRQVRRSRQRLEIHENDVV
ncbi:MAG: tRNA lysidine(34) synthetase TilS [Actinobacteria bacterium]|nr:tRNA lysidine(34) synthetase TilS [Actinomycetota bacterium]